MQNNSERFGNGNILKIDDIKIVEQNAIAQQYYKEFPSSKYSRSNLYSGKIKFNELQEIAKENKNTLPGCIFIAEVCHYFGCERLGKQCIQGFKIDNSNLSNEEKEILNKAISILTKETEENGLGEVRWNEIYENIEKIYRKKEDNDNVER